MERIETAEYGTHEEEEQEAALLDALRPKPATTYGNSVNGKPAGVSLPADTEENMTTVQLRDASMSVRVQVRDLTIEDSNIAMLIPKGVEIKPTPNHNYILVVNGREFVVSFAGGALKVPHLQATLLSFVIDMDTQEEDQEFDGLVKNGRVTPGSTPSAVSGDHSEVIKSGEAVTRDEEAPEGPEEVSNLLDD